MRRMPRELHTHITTLFPPPCTVRLTAVTVAQDHVRLQRTTTAHQSIMTLEAQYHLVPCTGPQRKECTHEVSSLSHRPEHDRASRHRN
jgi:hypothetical protein